MLLRNFGSENFYRYNGDLERNNYRAYTRNKLIAEAFFLTGEIEKYGSRFLRIRKKVSIYPTMKLTVEEIPNGLNVMLSYTNQKVNTHIPKAGKTVGETVGENLKGNSALILSYLRNNPHSTREELAKKTKLSIRGVEYQLTKLRKANIIKKIGSTKTGFWKVLD